MENEETTDRTRERGSVMVIAALAMTALLLFAALAIDVGAVWSSRTQSQNAADAAALAAASKMIAQSGSSTETVDLAGAQQEGNTYGGLNSTVGVPSVNVRVGGINDPNTSDFTFGSWDLQTRTFTPLSGAALSDTHKVRAVRAKVLMDNVVNDQSPSFLSRLIGRYGYDVKNEATAYRGFAGSFPPGDFDLPVAIEDRQLGGCEGDFCATASTVNRCPNETSGTPLRWPQGNTNVTCLEFNSTPEQNACWTVYNGSSPSINPPDLEPIVNDGNPGDVEAGDRVYLDNGNKDTTLKYMRNKFYGCNLNNGKNCGKGVSGTAQQMGFDRYGPNPAGSPSSAPKIDSWVVKLPVFESQAAAHCAGGSPGQINGGVCFEIREILAPSGDYADSKQIIKGRFLCPNSPDETDRALFDQYCRQSGDPGPGGCDNGISAQSLVLVK